MHRRLLSCAALLAALVGCTGGGDDATSGNPTGSTSSTGAGGHAGGGGRGGAGGGETLPDLDPAPCIAADPDGEDPSLADAAAAQYAPAFAPPSSGSVVQDKAFFFVTILRADADVAADPALATISADRDARLRQAPAQCAEDVDCYSAALLWSDAEAASAADTIAARLMDLGTLGPFADGLRATGRFSLHALLDDAALVRAAHRDLVSALAETFGAQASALGGAKLRAVVEDVIAAHPAPLSFIEPLLEVDLAALAADGRDEAARYEPLEEGENAKAFARISTIDWAQFPYTVILVPGLGPTDLDTPLSAGGAERCDLAAKRFAAGLAPLIAVSGGHVHPDRTPYSEAIEMKRYLRETHAIPEGAILVDPHARHTTTNLRNVSRLLYRYGVPADRPVLVTSDFGQSLYIGYWHGTFGPRCQDELGYLPWRTLVPLSQNDSCMRTIAVSLHADGRDPLDP